MSFKEHGFEIFRGMIDSDQCLDLIKTIREMWDTGNNCLDNPHPCDIIGLETVVSSQTTISYKNIL